VTAFATDPAATVTPLTAPQMLLGFACGTLNIGQINWAFQQLFKGATPATGAGIPVAAPTANSSPFYINTATAPETLYFWDGAAWQQIGGSSGDPVSGAVPPVAAPVVGASKFYINTATTPDTLYHYDGAAWQQLTNICCSTGSGAGAPVAAPAAGFSDLYIETGTTPDTLWRWDGATWTRVSAPFVIPSGAGVPVVAPTASQPGYYIDTLAAPDQLYRWTGTVWLPVGVNGRLGNYAVDTPTAVGVGTRIHPLNISTFSPDETPAYAILVPTNCTVVINLDGSHTVTPSIIACTTGVWSYTWSATRASDGALSTGTVSGTVTNTQVLYPFAVTAQTYANITITTALGAPYDILWGDGATSLAVPSGTIIDHTYGVPFTGNVTVRTSACSPPTVWNSTAGGWSFNIATIPSTLTNFSNGGGGALTGSINGLPPAMVTFAATGPNTISGSLSSLPATLTSLNVQGSNTITGPLSGLPPLLNYFGVDGNNTTSGSISTLPPTTQTYINGGANTTNGSITALPAELTYYSNSGANTTTGAVTGLPSGITDYLNFGLNTTSGTLIGLPATLIQYQNAGLNTVSGDVANVPPLARVFRSSGNSTVTSATSVWGGPTTNVSFIVITGAALSALAVDRVLAALATVTSWAGARYVDVAGANATPTAAGVASRLVILGNGATTVLTN
jgi:hypothetical protein